MASYPILSSANMVNIGSGDGLFPVRNKAFTWTLTDVLRADWYHWIH